MSNTSLTSSVVIVLRSNIDVTLSYLEAHIEFIFDWVIVSSCVVFVSIDCN